MSRTNNLDSELDIPMHPFDSPSYGRQSTRKPLHVPNDGGERKEAVIILVLMISILLFFVIKSLMDHHKRSKNLAARYRSIIKTEVVRAESSQIQPHRHLVCHTRNDTREMNRPNGCHSYGSSEVQVHHHDLGQLGSQNRSPWHRESVLQHQVLSNVLRTDAYQEDRMFGRDQLHRTSSPSARVHLSDDDLRVDQHSNRSVSCQDLPPSYEMITECSILNSSSSLLYHADSGPAVLDLAAPPSYTDVIRGQILLSGYSNDIELFSNECESENESYRS